MSHWTRVKTKISNQDHLETALQSMGYEFQKGDFKISQYGTTEKAEIKLDDAVGFSRQEDGTFAMIGDFYHSKNQKLKRYYGRNNQFALDVGNAYAVAETESLLGEQQFHCTDSSEENEVLTMVFER